MTSETQANNYVAGSYVYNTDGQRVRRKVNGVETWQVHGFGGELLVEYAASAAPASPQKEYGYRNGQLLVTVEMPSGVGNGYLYSRSIAINHLKVPNTDQADFPVLISGTYAYLATVANGGKVQNANGYDVIFTSDSGCATKLNHEVESYNATSGAVNYWVKVPSLSHSSDSVIYMCYGNASITTDQANPTGVWDTNYKGVWHLGNGSTLSGADSTNQLNGTNHSATAVTGKVGGGAGFNGTNQNVSVGTSGLTSGITLEAWLYRTGANGFDIFADFGWNSTDGFVALVGGPVGNNHGFVKHAVQYVDSGVASALNSWEHIVWTVAADKKPRLYVNGALVFTSSDAQSLVAATHGGSLGSRLDAAGNASQYFTGKVDEARLSNTVRSADWIATEYNNQSSPATFYTIAANSTAAAQIQWLVTDQLGTPRMIFDKTGALATVKRHDYLPFGEELFAGTGGRTTIQGYSGDSVRQKFTQKERDIETGLDYSINRYYSSTQGRFTSADPIPMTSQRPSDPQRLNLYAYVRNNPLTNIDPNGLDLYATGDEAERFRKDLEKATHLKLKLDSKTGKITIDGKTPKNMSDAAKQIAKIIGDTKNTVRVDAVRDSSPHDYVGGRFDGGGKQTINYADVDQLSKKGGFDSRAGAVHETTEAYAGLLDPKKTPGENHFGTGIPYENMVRQDLGLGRRVPGSESGGMTFGNETFVTVDYTTHLEHYTLVQTGQGKFVIKDVVVEKKKQ